MADPVPYVDNISTGIATDLLPRIQVANIPLLTVQQLSVWISSYLYSTLTRSTNLEDVEPEYEKVALQLMLILQTKPVWSETIPASIGQTFVEMTSAIFEQLQLNMEMSSRETILDTSVLLEDKVAISRMLGNHIIRKNPATRRINITRPTTTNTGRIPPLTQFLIDTEFFFNRRTIVWPVGVATVNDVPIYQGEITTETKVSSGLAFQRFEIGAPDFSVSDTDLSCAVNGIEYTRVTDGLWKYTSQDRVFFENTLPNGNVEVIFGNGVFGVLPPTGHSIVFTYARTKGATGNSTSMPQGLSVSGFANITGTVIAAATEGTDERDSDFITLMAPYEYSARDRAVNRNDFETLACLYDGVVDARAEGQHELGPSDLRQMNRVRLSLVTRTAWTNPQINRFKLWLNDKTMFSLNIDVVMATAVDMAIIANVYIKTSADADEVQQYLLGAIDEKFRLRRGILGSAFYISDLAEVLVGEGIYRDLITRFNIVQPVKDVELTGAEAATRYIRVSSVTLNMLFDDRSFTQI